MINVKKGNREKQKWRGVYDLNKNEEKAIVFFEFPCTCYKTVSKI